MKSMIEALTGYSLQELRGAAAREHELFEKERNRADRERGRADRERGRADRERGRADRERGRADEFSRVFSDQVCLEVCNAYKIPTAPQRVRDFLSSVRDCQTFVAIRNLLTQCVSLSEFEKGVEEIGRQRSSEEI